MVASDDLQVKAIDEASGQKCFWEGSISAINVLFSDCRKCLDLIFLYLSGMIISNWKSTTDDIPHSR
jgi:hypothetical protein